MKVARGKASKLTHVGPSGEARMVDISAKPVTSREARARGSVTMSTAALEAIMRGNLPKGEVIGAARIAGIQAAKRTSELIPMCHPLALTMVDVVCRPDTALPGIQIESVVRCEARTGAEMEALTGPPSPPVAGAATSVAPGSRRGDLRRPGSRRGDLRRPR